MLRILRSLAGDVVRFNLGGLVAVAVGFVDLLSGQHLGSSVDTTLVVLGFGALGLHVADTVGEAADIKDLASK